MGFNPTPQGVKSAILILSGKGGVGKSTISTVLAYALATTREDCSVALMDLDICGPSVPRMTGSTLETIHASNSGWSPVYVEDNLAVMSIGFMLPSSDEAVIWRGPKKNGLIKQFLKDVDWGDQDYMIIDTPPGTSDEHLSIVQYLPRIQGAVLVTTPQEISLQDVRKEINFCKKTKVPIIGVVENMSGFTCPSCQTTTPIFPATSGGAQQMCAQMGVPYLGAIPLDPRVAKACDEGANIFARYPGMQLPVLQAYRRVVDQIVAFGTQ